MKTVYFLGAGASRASEFELPCMEGFFREADFADGNYTHLFKFIKDVFPSVEVNKLNLEEVITCLELSMDTFGCLSKPAKVYVYEARRQFDRYVSQRVGRPVLGGCKRHKEVIDVGLAGAKSKDSIITLNYDLIVDHTLYELSPKEQNKWLRHGCLLDRMYNILGKTLLIHGERASIFQDYEELGFYLKLHGSIDWLFCSNNSCGNHQLFFPNWLGNPAVHNEPGDLCSLCGSPLVNVIVPPTMHKSFEKFPKLGLVWSLAYRELNKADRIVMFGVSFAQSDYYLRWLVKKAVGERTRKPIIFDINIDEDVSEQIKKITGVDPVHNRTLEEFLERE